jgi:hypothetical protein
LRSILDALNLESDAKVGKTHRAKSLSDLALVARVYGVPARLSTPARG